MNYLTPICGVMAMSLACFNMGIWFGGDAKKIAYLEAKIEILERQKEMGKYWDKYTYEKDK